MILTALIVSQLLSDSAAKVEIHGTGKITNADQSVSKLDLNHLAVREVVILKTLAVALTSFADLTVDEQELLRDGALLWREKVVPPTGSQRGSVAFFH